MSDVTIVPFDPDRAADYAALSELMAVIKPEYPMTPAELKAQDSKFGTFGETWWRWFARDASGAPIGYTSFVPALWLPAPGKFFPGLGVHPAYQGKGVGKELYSVLWDELQNHSPTYLKIEWREDMIRAVRFFMERDFREVGRYYESRLDIAAFDCGAFATDFDTPLEKGIDIYTWGELKNKDTDADYKIWDAAMEISRDVPSDELFEPMPIEDFQTIIMSRPHLPPDGAFVAVDRKTGQYVGISHVWLREADNDLDTGLTGVRRAYRRRGIALALKLRVLRWAQSRGFSKLRTGNDVNNRPMLLINERLGFEKMPPWLELVWKPTWESSAA